MSFWIGEVHRLKAAGGAVWDEYQRLVAAADQAMHDSPAHKALGEFQQAWAADPAGVTAAIEAKGLPPVEAGAAEAAEVEAAEIGCTDVRRNLLDSLLVALLLSGTFVMVMEMVRP